MLYRHLSVLYCWVSTANHSAYIQMACPSDEGLTLGLWSVLANSVAVNTTLTSLGLASCAIDALGEESDILIVIK